LALTVVVVRSIPPLVPHPTEAYEGFGDALATECRLVAGGALSVMVSLVVAGVVGAWFARQGGGNRG